LNCGGAGTRVGGGVTLGSNGGTAAQGSEEAGVRRRLRGEREGRLRLRKGGGAASTCGSPVQRMPRLPRVVAARPHPSAGALLEGPRRGTGPTCGLGERAQGCGGAGPRRATGGRAGGERNRGGGRRRGKEDDLRAPAGRGRTRERRERSGWAAGGKGERERGRWAAGGKGRPKGRKGSWLGYLL
jgi:hypothetical protein